MSKKLEIDPGYYIVRQADQEVGRVCVLAITSGKTEEHWILYGGYGAPSATSGTVSMAFEYDAELGMENLFTEVPSGSTYVIASCVVTAMP